MFIKANNTPYQDALIREAEGLDLLRRHIPEHLLRVVEVSSVDEKQLAMTAVKSTAPTEYQWQKLAEGLAVLHSKRQCFYGFQKNNYIGLNPQINEQSQRWGEFFVTHRLRYQINLISNAKCQKEFHDRLDCCRQRLTEYLDESCAFPSLVHGDLWSGNVLFDNNGDVWLIDPAVYFGDREVDIAMTEMFGGFSAAFYRTYEQQLPLSDEYPHKKYIYNFYHYLNHLNLFGESYLAGCERGMAAIESL